MSLTAPLAATFEAVDAGWRPLVESWRDSSIGQSLVAAIDARLAAGAIVYPPKPLRALELTPRRSVKVVIVGQDPYHRPGQADGLAFSVPHGVALPPSLRNIVGELARDLALPIPSRGQLDVWARRGVLLLNTVLTVEAGRPASHARLGWEALTDMIIEAVAGDAGAKAFMLWGAHAQSKAASIESAGHAHLVLRCNHPSPLAATRRPLPFSGCGHFGRANVFLAARGIDAVDWSLR